MADIDATLVQQMFDISKRMRKADIHHHRKADNFGKRFEIAEGTAICHSPKLGQRPVRLKRFCSDSAVSCCYFSDQPDNQQQDNCTSYRSDDCADDRIAYQYSNRGKQPAG